ncbi:hypothetical protein RIF29_19982 [Crotalaria pallida]|uniref:Uncharacterized protein n=1 Tax=Crotalaria pallida TaxID=3830 RepID=A0AAN9F4N4_CROPI
MSERENLSSNILVLGCLYNSHTNSYHQELSSSRNMTLVVVVEALAVVEKKRGCCCVWWLSWVAAASGGCRGLLLLRVVATVMAAWRDYRGEEERRVGADDDMVVSWFSEAEDVFVHYLSNPLPLKLYYSDDNINSQPHAPFPQSLAPFSSSLHSLCYLN